MDVYGMDDYIYSDIGSERFFLCLINNSSYVPLHASKFIFSLFTFTTKGSWLGQLFGVPNREIFKIFQTNFLCVTDKHCVKSFRILSYSDPHFSTFALNTERYSVSLRI